MLPIATQRLVQFYRYVIFVIYHAMSILADHTSKHLPYSSIDRNKGLFTRCLASSKEQNFTSL